MTATVIITAHSQETHVYNEAMQFCKGLVSANESIGLVFFMHEANLMAVDKKGREWSKFSEVHGVELQTCSSTAEYLDIPLGQYLPNFQQTGLSALADSLMKSNRVMQFPVIDEYSDKLLQRDDKASAQQRFTFVFRTAPVEASLAIEGLDLLFVLSAFDAELAVVFIEEGKENICHHENHPRYVRRFKALSDFGIETRYVLGEVSTMQTVPVEQVSQQQLDSLLLTSYVLVF